MNVTFDFGETEASYSFLQRRPKFFPAFERLMVVGNKCYGRGPKPRNRAEHVVFGLGHACRQDFLEVLFMGVNGYSTGALKLIRGLFERTIALAYIVKHPEKAERLVRFGAIQEYKGLVAALRVVSEEAFDAGGGGKNTAAQIRGFYEQVKAEFQTTLCRKCGNKGTAFSWDDRDVPSMVAEVDTDDHLYRALLLGCYTVANWVIHTSLISAMEYEKENVTPEADVDTTIGSAILLYLRGLQEQNDLFSLGIQAEIETCYKDFNVIFGPPEPSAE